MDDNKFFRLIWRINAVGLAALLCAAALIMAIEILPRLTNTYDRTVFETVNVDTTDDTLHSQLRIESGPIIASLGLIPIHAVLDQSYTQSGSYSGYEKSTRANAVNFGLYDTSTGKQRWIFPTPDQLLHNTRHLTPPCGHQDCPVTAFAFVVIAKDTNGDKRLTLSDAAALWLAAADGNGLTKITDLPSANTSITYADTNTLIVSKAGDSELTMIHIDLRTLTQTASTTVTHP